MLDKYARAEMAVRCGADLVVELPLAAALSSAEGFARGAVQTLHALGCGTVSFGAETADTDLLLQAAELLNSLPMKGESGSPTCPTPLDGRKNSAKSTNRLPRSFG